MRMPGTKLCLLTWLLLMTQPLWAEIRNLPIPITDEGAPDAPIRASGQVVFHEEVLPDSVKTRWETEIRLINASGKSILAYELSIEAFPDYGGGVSQVYQSDAFFLPQLEFAPGVEQTLSFSNPGLHVSPRNASTPPMVPRASVRVLFVEFADGSKVGTSNWAVTLSEARQRASQRLQEMLAEYATSGEAGLRGSLTASLGRQNELRSTLAVMTHVKGTLDLKGTSAAIAEVREFLSVAQTRKQMM